ncbi:homoserine dehydrogenase [Cyanobacterium aponinum AL20118]|uniref:Homoserine dehydrogenase n=2 Tax=Cyanobacterium aponinum TaxID=379064 RepID=K9Z4J4_CYAAP|nr:homoserine dehydrogenase [Cyanobacterium aponinum]AFZ53505.1 homoserine dehydrogenase [Cyanobacterium aponinum PCC 10605]MBD2393374.1 homoserine dehydrogenase [Cyanobacterium aponinum FACHB-4101]PHV63470.1 homoserine dehydrogenase [Cyanobacterium aponinum IPPAS B-1201]WPF89814.1 homoserine dehydrogenase [Cyanobacterium aponinum AL20115]
MAFKIGLLGLGTVGTGTADILFNPDGRHPLLQNITISQVGVKSLEKKRNIDLPSEILTTDLEAIVTNPEIDIVVELIGGLEPARSLILKAIAHGKHVVTANKAVIARYGGEIFAAANEAKVYVLSEAAVGGGIPIVEPLKQSLGANRLENIIGIVNGTTNYILTEMTEKGSDFGQVLKVAQDLGYAEADPTADVEGYDAADKIAILASLAFGCLVKREDVYCEGITKITSSDINYAEKLGFVIKLLAIAHKVQSTTETQLQLRVHPTFVPTSHPLANVNGVNNAILVEGSPLGQVMFYGPGAGSGPTASAVVADIMNIVGVLNTDKTGDNLDSLLSCSPQGQGQISPIEEVFSRFYARFLCADVPGVIGHLGTAFGENNVSLESVVQIGFQGDLAEIVVVTHHVREGNFREAIAEIRSLNAIKNIPSIIRVL